MLTIVVKTAAQDFFPLDKQLGLGSGAYSGSLVKQMVWLSALLPYQQAAEVFERIAHRSIHASSLWRQSGVHGRRMRAYLKQQEQRVKPERVVLPPPGQDHRQAKGVSMDGGMVNIRGEGWKEMKVGAIFDVQQQLAPDPVSGEWVLEARGQNVKYAAELGPPEVFGPAIWRLAVESEVPQAAKSSVTADGAEWIWNLAKDYFPDSEQIVDWYHACEHLHQAACALFPEEAEKSERWYNQRRANLYLGELGAITGPLDQAGLSDQSRYFHVHHRRMRYQEFREEGYPIGSGTVESGIKQFKARLTGPGMRWSRPGAENMLVIRCAVMSQTFDQLWAAAEFRLN